MPNILGSSGATPRRSVAPSGGTQNKPDPSTYKKYEFQIGKDKIEYYRELGDTDKVFIPANSLSKITLLSPESAKNLMEGDA